MGDDADITEEWAQRIMCAVEGVPFESSKLHIYKIDNRDAKKKEGVSTRKPIFWVGTGCWKLADCIAHFGKGSY